MLDQFSSWREPLAGDWRERASALQTALKGEAAYDQTAVAAALRRLAGQRLGDAERLIVGRMVRRASARGGLAPFRTLRTLLVSNRTTSFFAGDLEAAGPVRNLLIEPVQTDYDVVASIAFDPTYAAPAGPFAATVLLLDHGFFASADRLLDVEGEQQRHAEALGRLEGVCSGLRERFSCPLIVATLALDAPDAPTSADPSLPGSAARLVSALNQRIHEGGRNGEWLVWDLSALAANVGASAWFDPVRFHEAKTPFSLDVSPIAADSLAALLAAMSGRAGRALALDLDNTLWGGVVADDGLSGIRLGSGSAEGEAFASFQRYLLNMRTRGVVLAVCSKNIEAIAREPFQRHPEMSLKEDHVAVFVADFADKATNVAAVARALDLDTSSIVFVDDNPAERERVRSELPFALVPEIGEDPALYSRRLAQSGFLEHLPLTSEDAKRADAYAGRAAAKALQETIGNYDEYLQSLQMRLSIGPFSAMDRARIVQLVQKSNQFNLTTKRYSETEIAAHEESPDHLGWTVRLSDRFADHGLIGVVIVEKAASEWTIDSWIMSCRVLERGVEQALMNSLFALAGSQAIDRVVGIYRPTQRNGLVKDFFDRFGFRELATNSEQTTYAMDVSDFRPAVVHMALSNP